MKRRKHFRGVAVTLECGHRKVLASSFYRLTEDRAACIVGHAVRGGTFCSRCGAKCMIEGVHGTVRLDDDTPPPAAPGVGFPCKGSNR